MMSNANKVGNTRRVYEGVKALRGKSERPPCNLSTNSQGVPLADAAAVAETWEEFLTKKFAATEAEARRPPMSTLPITRGTEQLSRTEIEEGLKKMQKGKACGPDNIPVIVFKQSPICRDILVALLQKIWDTEVVPPKFARATFVMLFKQKG